MEIDLTLIESLLADHAVQTNIDLTGIWESISMLKETVEISNTQLIEFLTTSLEPLVQQNELLLRLYTGQLFVIGVSGAILVLFLLYKFVRSFY